MSGLCGWFDSERSGSVDPQAIATMAAQLNRFDNRAIRNASAAFGAVGVVDSNPNVFQDSDRLVAVWGHAHFDDLELSELAKHQGLSHALAQGYARMGTDVLAALMGSFALAILDGTSGDAVLAVDRTGTRPLSYGTAKGKLVFGSTLDAIRAIEATPPELNRQAIYDYVYFHMIPGPNTIHPGRYRLLPGTFLRWRKGKAETACYWKMRFTEDERRPLSEVKQGFLDVMRKGVREAARDGTVGAFLSGGTDSSTIAGLLGEVTGQPAQTYSIGFEAQGYDEMEFARVAARHFGTKHHEYYVTPEDVVNAIPQIAAVHDQPFGNSSAVPTYYCAKLAKEDGMDVLLGGDGGDELFGGNERYAKQYLYSLYSDLPRTLRKGFVEPIVGLLPAVSLIGKVQRYMQNASMPMPARYDNYNLLERLGPNNVFTTNFLRTMDVNHPRVLVADTYQAGDAQSLINRMLALDLKFTLADNDLPKVSRSCELAGVEARFPILNDAVVAFSARLSPDLKLKRTQLRYLFKEALRGFLPNEIITKSKHGFGLPFGVWLQEHKSLRQLVSDSLNDLKRRDIVRPQFIDELLGELVNSHAGYYGTMAWVLMMLEQWLKCHTNTA